MITWRIISAAEQVRAWRTIAMDRNAEGWSLPKELRDSLLGAVLREEPANSRLLPIHASNEDIYRASHRKVDKCLDRCFPCCVLAAADVLLHGVGRDAGTLQAQLDCRVWGVDPTLVEGVILRNLQEMHVGVRERRTA